MKVLIVTPGRLPVPASRGGAVETLIDMLLKYNECAKEHEIHVVTIADKKAEESGKNFDYAVFHFVKMGALLEFASAYHILPYRMLDYFFSKKGVRILKAEKHKFDRIIIQNEIINGKVFSKTFESRYIYHAHNNPLEKGRRFGSSFLQSCSSVLTVSEFLGSEFRNRAKLYNNVTVYNGIDTELFDREKYLAKANKLREQYGIDKDEIVIMYAGRIAKEKGIVPLLEAFLTIPSEEKITLVIVGASFYENSKETAFVKKIKKMSSFKKDKIIFTGYVKHEEMPEYYSMADIGCIPSIWEEPFGLSVIEQMAMKLPVIVTDSGAIVEIANESCGFILRRNIDLTKNIASAIKKLAEDEATRRNMGESGREIVEERFSQKAFCEKWYESIK